MVFIKRLFLLVYMFLMISAGSFLVLLAANVISPEDWAAIIESTVSFVNIRVVVGVIGAIILFIGIIQTTRGFKKSGTAKMLTFQNPDGEVSVSVAAIENYIRRVAIDVPGIKEINSKIGLSKRGIDVECSVSISDGINIPEATERIQIEVRNKIQSMLGIEETINLKMHINRIVKNSQSVGQVFSPEEEELEAPQIPYREIN